MKCSFKPSPNVTVLRVRGSRWESVPDGATQWGTRTMARESGPSQTTVSRIWRAFGLQPYHRETFKLSTDPMIVNVVREYRVSVHGADRHGDGAV